MKRISLVSLLALSFTLASIALIVSAGGPVTGKTDIYDPAPGIGRTIVSVANMHPSQSATVQVSKFFMDGAGAASSITTTLESSGRSATFSMEDAPYSDWHGTAMIESDKSLATVTQIIWEEGGDGDGTTSVAYIGSHATPTELFFPYIASVPGSQFTRFAITNVGASATGLRFQYFQNDGTPESAIVITDTLLGYPITATGWSNTFTPPDVSRLQPGHTRIYDMHIPGTQVPELTNWGGSLKVTALDGQGLAGVATNYWTDVGAATYNPLITGTLRSNVPSIERRKDGEQWLGYSVIRIQCISADSDGDCDVSADLSPSANSPSTETLSLTCAIAENATKGINTQKTNANRCGASMLTSTDWVGSATIWTTDTSKIGVVSFSLRDKAEMSLGYTAADENNASTTVYAPDIYVMQSSGVTLTQWSIISVQNITTTQSASVSLNFLGRKLPNSSHLTDTVIGNIVVQPGEVFRLNTREHYTSDAYGIDETLGNQWEGSLRVDSDIPVAVVAETHWSAVDGRKMNAYNGIPYP